MASKTRIGFIGCGWRAHGYMRVIRELSDRLEVSGIYTHSEKSFAKMNSEYPGLATDDFESFIQMEHDFVMLLVPRSYALQYIEELLKRNIPVLCETPPADGVEELERCLELKKKYQGKIQVAEQYFLQPYHQAVMNLIEQGIFGEISNITIRMIHDYHALSMMRKYLGKSFEMPEVRGQQYQFPVLGHCDRAGLHKGGTGTVMDSRMRADFIYDDGKTGFYDFSDEQYFNYFRTRHINIQGYKGEICDEDVCFMGDDGYPVQAKLVRDELGANSNLEGCGLRSITFLGKVIYKNPYFDGGYRLNDDEIAMAGILEGMANYVKTGEEIYSLEDGCQDTRLYLMMYR